MARKGTQPQYVEHFNQAVEKYLPQAFNNAGSLRPAQRRNTVVTNLLVLVNGLANVRFSVLAVNKLEDENVMVRYWAVQCLSNPEVVSQLNAGQADNPNLPQEITAKLANILPGSSAEVCGLIARYAAAINIPQGQDLLMQVADQRIKSYADSTVKEEFVDATILKLLESKISNPGENTKVAELARRFAQLYSYVVQRYVNNRGALSEPEKIQLVTVIVEVEDKCIRNMVGTQSEMRKAIEQGQMQALMDEHNRLLGSSTSQGLLPEKYHFSYGNSVAGSAGTSPLLLSANR